MNFPTYILFPPNAQLWDRPVLASVEGYALVRAFDLEAKESALKCLETPPPMPLVSLETTIEEHVTSSCNTICLRQKRYRVGANVFIADGTPDALVLRALEALSPR